MLKFIKYYLRKIIFNLTPLFVFRWANKLMPPTATFQTTLGRRFRLIKVDNDFCIAISSEKYDAEVAKELTKLKQQGEEMIDTAVAGLNMLSIDNREQAILDSNREEIRKRNEFLKNATREENI